MARYGTDYGRDFDRWDRGGRYDGWGGFGGGGGAEAGYSGMRPHERGPGWGDVSGEQGWYGGRYPGSSGGYDVGFGGGGYGGGGYGGWGGGPGSERYSRGPGGGYGGDYGGTGGRYDADWGRGYSQGGFGGGYGGGGYGGGGYMEGYSGGDAGYGTGSVGERGGWGRGAQRMRAAELMTENPECVTPDTTLAQVAQKMRDLDVGIIPVVDSHENRRLQGVITDRDIAVRAIAEGKDGSARVSDYMTRDVETCNKNDSVEQVLEVMKSEQVRRVPITDREGRLVGIIAQADVAVEYAGNNQQREMRVEDTIERISEPARPERSDRMATRGRGGEGGIGGQSQRGGTSGGMSGGKDGGMTTQSRRGAKGGSPGQNTGTGAGDDQ